MLGEPQTIPHTDWRRDERAERARDLGFGRTGGRSARGPLHSHGRSVVDYRTAREVAEAAFLDALATCHRCAESADRRLWSPHRTLRVRPRPVIESFQASCEVTSDEVGVLEGSTL